MYPPMPLRIFISYGHDENAELARRLNDDLEARGHETWFDERDIAVASDWEHVIEEGLHWCARPDGLRRVMLLMTPHAVRRPDGYCLNEITFAVARSLPIVPVMVVFAEPPLSIYRIQWLDMQECVPVADRGAQYERAKPRLFEALEQSNLDFDGNWSHLYHVLAPLDFGVEIARHVPQFAGRQWLLKRIDVWLPIVDSLRNWMGSEECLELARLAT